MQGCEIAIVGMACRFPGAKNPSAFWRNLCDGIESIRFFSDEEMKKAGVSGELLANPDYVMACGALDDMEMFDAGFFNFSPRDAAIMDPQHRHFLECAWEALESAGYDPGRYGGSIGVFAGSGMTAYMMYNLAPNAELMDSVGEFLIRHTGNDKDFLATRVSYNLNLRGPSVSVQTACSTSLVAVHMAAQSLLNGECDMALAGGVTILIPQDRGYLYKENEILSPDGHCRAFDTRSQGTVFGSGAGVVVLKRLTDAVGDRDTILAVIRGSAVNNDGGGKVGYLAPSVDGQAAAIAEAVAVAGVSADTISYVETHGTGTPIGDPIEIAAMTQAFRQSTDRNGFCAIGSVKSNIGHLDTAAGVAGIIKTVLALRHRRIPASLHFEQPNPEIDFANSPFFVNAKLTEWKRRDEPLRAGVSSLGVGGTNAHVIVEEAPDREPDGESRSYKLLLLSARSASALDSGKENLADHLDETPELNLADVAYTLKVGRKAFRHRLALVCRNVGDALQALKGADPRRVLIGRSEKERPPVVFMFPGGGAQYAGMGAELYRTESVYRDVVDRCSALITPELKADLRELMFGTAPEGFDLERPSLSLPALFATEYGLAKLLISWGISPAAMIGHSMGEYVAACLAGVMSEESALSLVALRGRLFETLPEGRMLSVTLSEYEARDFAGPDVAFAAINGPNQCVASGPSKAVAELEDRLREREIDCSRVHISVAAHSAMVDAILPEFERFCRSIRFQPPALPYVSNLTGTWIRDEEATDPSYWAQHLRCTVRFAEGLDTLMQESGSVLLEVGPGRTLTGLAQQQHVKPYASFSTLRHPKEEDSDVAFLLTTLARLWLTGVEVDWSLFYQGESRRRVPLPTYPFEHVRYWIEPTKQAGHHDQRVPTGQKKPDLADWFYVPAWNRTLPPRAGGVHGSWLVFGDETGLAARLIERLNAAGFEPNQASRLEREKPGEVASLRLCAVERRAPEPGEVEIRVGALGIQFADALNVLGLHPNGDVPLGLECAGRIARVGEGVTQFAPGDEVLAIGPDSFRSYVTRDARFVAHKPAGLTLEEAVTIPSAFLTAHYSLNHVAKLKTGERVLIHAATGGVGLAAIQLARLVGAEIFATAGSPKKRAFLEQLGIRNVFDSRTLEFVDRILEVTGGEGVDVVLNSLAGNSRAKSLSIVRPQGRFVELGKQVTYKDDVARFIPLDRDISYTAVDMDRVCEDGPELFQTLLLDVLAQFARGSLRPLPRHVFPWQAAADGFRLMIDAAHIGKIILSVSERPVDVVAVLPGESFARLGNGRYTINPANPGDYDALLREIGEPASRIDHVVHLWNVTPPDGKVDLDRSETLAFFSLVFLMQSLANLGLTQHIELSVVSNQLHSISGEVVPEPLKALLLGPCRVVPREFPNVTCRSIDIAMSTQPLSDRDTVERLIAEFTSGSTDAVVALRRRDRWVQSVEPCRIERVTESKRPVRDGGVYLITGGLGGIGLEVAGHFARRARVKLVLTGRTGLPPRSEWDHWVIERGERDHTSHGILAVKHLESLGAEVMVAVADVSDAAEMASVLRVVRAQFGPLAGVVHAAGVLDDGLIQLKSREAISKVLLPKVKGTIVLDSLLREEDLDFFLLFSSVSSVVGLPGQVDYCAANAFLDSFAQCHRHSVTAINWSAWQEVGIAAAIARGSDRSITGHPLVDRCVYDRDDRKVFATTLSAKDLWVLDGHRIQRGEAVLPGTAYLEMARQVLDGESDGGRLEVRDLSFLHPMVVAESGEVRIDLERRNGHYNMTVYSPLEGDDRLEHARAQMRVLNPAPAERMDRRLLAEGCSVKETQFSQGKVPTNQGKLIRFGRRWHNVKKLSLGRDGALAELELPPEFTGDLDSFQLHPALLDMATGFALSLIDGYEGRDDYYVPLSYRKVIISGRLSRKLYSYARCANPLELEMPSFDVTVFDEQGQVLVEVEDFTMKRVSGSVFSKSIGSSAASPAVSGKRLYFDLRMGLLTSEGIEVLDRIMRQPSLSQVIVSTQDLSGWLKQIDESTQNAEGSHGEGNPKRGDPAASHARPSLSTPFVAPRDDLEKQIAEIWQTVLGVDHVGIYDNFFEIGGHSLLLTQSITRLRRAVNIEVSLQSVFAKPTIADLAEEVRRANEGGSEAQPPPVTAVSREAYRTRRPAPNEDISGAVN